MLLGSKVTDYGHILENVVYLELLRRGYEVFIGKVAQTEVDFIATKSGNTEYYQVALSVSNSQTLERELRPLDSISDHNPKYILTMDEVPEISYKGIKQINAIDWLLELQ